MLINLRLTNFIFVKVLKIYLPFYSFSHFDYMLDPWEKMEIVDSFKLKRAMFWLYIQLFFLVSIKHALIPGILKIKILKIKSRT